MRPEAPFSASKMFVCTFGITLTNLHMKPEEMIGMMTPGGAIRALNCNYGHKAQAGYESFLKAPKPPVVRVPAQVGAGAAGRLAPAQLRPRQVQGDGSCFNSCVEFVVDFGPGAPAPPPAVAARIAAGKRYHVKIFPATGKTQIPGVLCEDLADGFFVAGLLADFLTAAGVQADPAAPIEAREGGPIMMNHKFVLTRADERLILNLSAIATHLQGLRATQEAGGEAGLPLPIESVTHPQDKQNISFKFVMAGVFDKKGKPKTVRVNMFRRGKVNFLGSANFETPRVVYGFLERLFQDNWAEFVVLQPRPDRPPRAAGGAPPRAAGRKAGGPAGGAAGAAAGAAAEAAAFAAAEARLLALTRAFGGAL